MLEKIKIGETWMSSFCLVLQRKPNKKEVIKGGYFTWGKELGSFQSGFKMYM